MGEGLEDDREQFMRKTECGSLDTSANIPLATTQSCDPNLNAREAGKCSLPVCPAAIDEHVTNFAKYLYIFIWWRLYSKGYIPRL